MEHVYSASVPSGPLATAVALPVSRYQTYYLKNRKRLQADARARYAATRGRRKVSMAAYNAAHRKEISASKSIYYTKNRDRILAYTRDRYHASRKLAAAGPELALAKKRR
jgi:hypothetical protein